MAIVEESQFSLAIGRQGQNVRLANRLCDWNIDVKTIEQAQDIDFSSVTTVATARNLFNDEEEYDEITTVAELPGVDAEVAALLKANGIEQIQDFVDAYENNSIHIENVTKEQLDAINNLINDNVEFVEEEEPAEEQAKPQEETKEEAEEEEYFCPECGAKITLDMTQCPNCGVEFEFAEDEE